MKAAVLSIGSELLRGDIVDTNAAYLTRQLSQLSFDVRRVIQVGDELDELTDVVKTCLKDVDIILATGGLGPTQDDLTRDAIAAAVGEDMYLDSGLVSEIESRFAALRRPMPTSNSRQAMLIPSAAAMANPNGTAPGWYVQKDDRIVAAMPGPPSEMQPMWRDHVHPRLGQLLSGATSTRTLITFGLGESTVEQRIDDVIGWRHDVTVATYAKTYGVEVHITAHAGQEPEANALLEEADARIRQRLGRAVFGSGEETLSGVVGRLLVERGLTLSIMESATGGELANQLTNSAGSSEYFLGGVIAYSRAVKEANGVPPAVIDENGLYSSATAIAMARSIRERLGSDVGLGVTGIAGEESLEGKPSGTCYVALSMNEVQEFRAISRPGRRDLVKRFFAQSALDLLRRQLQHSVSDIR